MGHKVGAARCKTCLIDTLYDLEDVRLRLSDVVDVVGEDLREHKSWG